MTTHLRAASATGLPEYDDDRILHDLHILRQHLAAAGDSCLDIGAGESNPQRVFALVETAKIYVEHINRNLTAAAYPNNPEARS